MSGDAPIHPVAGFPHAGGGELWATGLTKREHYAGLALLSLGTWCPAYDEHGAAAYLSTESGQRLRAQWAVAQADALIAALASADEVAP